MATTRAEVEPEIRRWQQRPDGERTKFEVGIFWTELEREHPELLAFHSVDHKLKLLPVILRDLIED